MSTSCEQILELLTASAVQAGSWPQELEAHLEGCPACAAWASRLSLHTRALGELQSVGAPAALEGRVVAAMHGGQREDRAVAELLTLGAAQAPAELDGRILALFADLRAEGLLQPTAAPEELEERVDSDLQDLPAATSAHLLSKLTRLEAPAELEARLEGELSDAQRPKNTFQLVWTRQRALAAGVAAAACLALWAGFSAGPRQSRPQEPLFPFEVVVLDRSSELSPAARGMLDAVSGGALQLLEAASRQPFGLDQGVATQRTFSGAGTRSQAPVGSQPSRTAPTSQASGSASTSAPSLSGPGGLGAGSGGQQLSTSAGSLFDQVAHSLSTTALRGVRSVHLFQDPADPSTEVEYLEELATDGQGNFTIVPRDVLVPNVSGADLAQFQLLQSAREGFFFRSRDFDVRDVTRFAQAWTVTDLALQMEIAGVTTSVFDLARADGMGRRYRLAIDPQTAVVLSQEELTPEGQLLSRVQFLSLAYDADLSDLALTGGPSQWTPVNLSDPTSYSFTLLRPTAPPSGFGFERAATLSSFGPTGSTWVRLTYGDGVDEVYFAYDAASAGASALRSSIKSSGDTLRVLSFGSWTVVEGDVGGRKLMVVGKADKDDLLLMLQSAFETL